MSRLGTIGTDYTDPIIQQSLSYPLEAPHFTKGILQDNILDPDTEYNGIYFNKFQEMLMLLTPWRVFVRGGRGLGKTTIIAYRMLQMVYSLPQASFALLGSSVAQLYQKCVPGVIEALEMFGYHEGVDFVRGHAPKKFGFAEPLSVPRRWDNVLHFSNGSIFYLISTAVVGATNSMNLAGIIIDEARFQPYKKIIQEVRPSIRTRPNPAWSRKNPLYLSEAWFSDGGVTAKQREWEAERNFKAEILPYNEKLIQMVGTLKRAHQVDELHGTSYEQQFANNLQFCAELQHNRAHSTMWLNCSSLMNAEILVPQGYFERMKDSMPPVLFNVHILGHEVGVDKSTAFYSTFNPDIHTYRPSDSDEVNSLYDKKNLSNIETSRPTDDCLFDKDVNPKLPLLIAFDWNKNVNALVVGQTYKYKGMDTLMILKTMFVVNPDFIEKLCADFATYYALHPTKEVIFYADSTAKQGTSYASRMAEEYRFDNIVKRELNAHGWKVTIVDIGTPMRHDLKYAFMNSFFSGKEKLFPCINVLNNDYLIASLSNAIIDMRMGKVHKYKGDEKKKTGEGLSSDGELGANNYSDISDAFDTLCIGATKYGTHTQFRFGPSSVPLFDVEIL